MVRLTQVDENGMDDEMEGCVSAPATCVCMIVAIELTTSSTFQCFSSLARAVK